jgi:hypothetical protein
MEIILGIQKKMKEYRESWYRAELNLLTDEGSGLDEALLLQSQVLQLSKPSSRVFHVFQNWFEKERPFVGYGRDLLKQANEFVALSPSADQDILTRFLQNFGGRYFPVRK